MACIAFILLAHKDPDGVIAQALQLTADGDNVVIHYDRNAPAKEYRRIRQALHGQPAIAFAPRRFRCGWGQWSLVAATLSALRKAKTHFPAATHFYLLSGDCMPVKSARYARAFLDRDDCDHIESVDFHDSGWIRTGLKTERVAYRHWFNERRRRRLFYGSLAVQKWLGMDRPLPRDLTLMIGSQWWCLRRSTVRAVLNLTERRPDLKRFFRTTWIPDEIFFQSLVAHLVPRGEIRPRAPTLSIFTDYGMPVTFYEDHYDLLTRQSHLFARKISPEAPELRRRLGDLWQNDHAVFTITDEAQGLYRYLTGRGRAGLRFAPRFWDDQNAAAPRRVCLIVAKKWHIAKRLTAQIRQMTDIPAVDYLFDEIDANLPDLGGIEQSLAKRGRHPGMLLRLLSREFGTDKLVLCLDPSAAGLVADVLGGRSQTRILFVETPFDDAYLRGHLLRTGIIAEATPLAEAGRLLPILRADLMAEAQRLCDLIPGTAERIAPDAAPDVNAAALQRFLDVSPDIAHDLATTPHLFAD